MPFITYKQTHTNKQRLEEPAAWFTSSQNTIQMNPAAGKLLEAEPREKFTILYNSETNQIKIIKHIPKTKPLKLIKRPTSDSLQIPSSGFITQFGIDRKSIRGKIYKVTALNGPGMLIHMNINLNENME